MRELGSISQRVVGILTLSLCLFHLYTGVFGLLPCFEQRAVHIALVIALVLILYPASKAGGRKTSVPFWDWLFVAFVMATCGWIFLNWQQFQPFLLIPLNNVLIFMAVATTLIVFEVARRSVGWVFPSLATVAVVYSVWGHYIPGTWGHPPFSLPLLIEYLFYSSQGMWGFLTGLSATYIASFLIFGAILASTGGGQTFIDLSLILAGRFRGGLAKVAVIASAGFGCISGSGAANVATTGNFTIPMMKRQGYTPEFAAAVEATASSGGVITPPVMGATAFIMAELLGISYLKVCVAAAIPALLFFLSVFLGVHFEAVRLNLQPVPSKDLPSLRGVLTWSRLAPLFIPVVLLLYLLIAGYSLTTVATVPCVAAIFLYFFRDLSLRGIKGRLVGILKVLEAGGQTIVSVAPILICASVVLFLLQFTGLALKLTDFITMVGQTSIFVAVLLTGVLVMFLGTGLPPIAAYLLGVIIAGPMLLNWGILPLAVHMFVIYYCVVGYITPPVCATVWIASGIAKSDWLKTAWKAIKLAPIMYLIPFLFIFNHEFLMIGKPWNIVSVVAFAIGGVIVLATGIAGQLLSRCSLIERLVLVASGVLLLLPNLQTSSLGLALVAVVVVKQLWQKKRIQLMKQ